MSCGSPPCVYGESAFTRRQNGPAPVQGQAVRQPHLARRGFRAMLTGHDWRPAKRLPSRTPFWKCCDGIRLATFPIARGKWHSIGQGPHGIAKVSGSITAHRPAAFGDVRLMIAACIPQLPARPCRTLGADRSRAAISPADRVGSRVVLSGPNDDQAGDHAVVFGSGVVVGRRAPINLRRIADFSSRSTHVAANVCSWTTRATASCQVICCAQSGLPPASTARSGNHGRLQTITLLQNGHPSSLSR